MAAHRYCCALRSAQRRCRSSGCSGSCQARSRNCKDAPRTACPCSPRVCSWDAATPDAQGATRGQAGVHKRNAPPGRHLRQARSRRARARARARRAKARESARRSSRPAQHLRARVGRAGTNPHPAQGCRGAVTRGRSWSSIRRPRHRSSCSSTGCASPTAASSSPARAPGAWRSQRSCERRAPPAFSCQSSQDLSTFADNRGRLFPRSRPSMTKLIPFRAAAQVAALLCCCLLAWADPASAFTPRSLQGGERRKHAARTLNSSSTGTHTSSGGASIVRTIVGLAIVIARDLGVWRGSCARSRPGATHGLRDRLDQRGGADARLRPLGASGQGGQRLHLARRAEHGLCRSTATPSSRRYEAGLLVRRGTRKRGPAARLLAAAASSSCA